MSKPENVSDLRVIANEPTDTFTIGERDYALADFSIYKGLVVARHLVEVLRDAGLTDIVQVRTRENGAESLGVDQAAIKRLLTEDILSILERAGDGFFALVALILMPNKQLADLETSGGDLKAVLKKEGDYIKHIADLDQALEVILAGVARLQAASAGKKLGKVLRRLTGMDEGTDTPRETS